MKPGPRPGEGGAGNITPTAILKLRGRRGILNERAGEPKPRRGTPKSRVELGESAKRFYKAVCRDLDAIGVLTVADGNALSRYSAYMARWNALNKEIDVSGEPATAFNAIHTIEGSLLKLEREFGLTPAARVRLAIVARNEVADDPGELFFANRRKA